MKYSILCIISGAFSFVLTSSVAVAAVPTVGGIVANLNQDGKTYPGTMCLPAQGAKVVNNTTGVLYNNSNSPQIWTCPIVRDVMKGQRNGITTAVVKGIDRHPFQNITCTLKSMKFHGGRVIQKTDNSADGNIAFQGLKSFPNGYYVLRCKVPGKFRNRRSGIRVYRINEKL
ncbi:MAG TPA: hypothetical protein ENJ86_08440 [Methylothermaceae bacterium]|nr:hypothetical protein [Methylothermaceae bacterium]